MEVILHTKVFLALCTSFLESNRRENASMWFGVRWRTCGLCFLKEHSLLWNKTNQPNKNNLLFHEIISLSLESKNVYRRSWKAIQLGKACNKMDSSPFDKEPPSSQKVLCLDTVVVWLNFILVEPRFGQPICYFELFYSSQIYFEKRLATFCFYYRNFRVYTK